MGVASSAGEPRIGPNAILRLAEALRALAGDAAAERIFERAGQVRHLRTPPTAMVDEREVAALYAALRVEPDLALVHGAACEAGTRTALYLLAHRIPRPAQRVLRLLPPWAASRALLAGIDRHAWTFAGSARFTHEPIRRGVRLMLAGNPMCRGIESQEPACGFYAATFERLFRELVDRRARVREVACEAAGGRACVFETRW
jgi:divinyl protochlorophyllide a 8-vinyl-reductase